MSKQVNVKVDAGVSMGVQEHLWRYIGYDECNYTYIPDGGQRGVFGMEKILPLGGLSQARALCAGTPPKAPGQLFCDRRAQRL